MLKPIAENVYAPHDPDDGGSEGLLAVIYKTVRTEDPLPPGAHFVTDPGLPLQVGVLVHLEGHVVAPHSHPPQPRTLTGTPEVLVVTDGRYELTVYTSRGHHARTVRLEQGDVALLVSGGHSLVCLDDGTMLEIKLGPFTRGGDKVPLTPRS